MVGLCLMSTEAYLTWFLCWRRQCANESPSHQYSEMDKAIQLPFTAAVNGGRCKAIFQSHCPPVESKCDCTPVHHRILFFKSMRFEAETNNLIHLLRILCYRFISECTTFMLKAENFWLEARWSLYRLINWKFHFVFCRSLQWVKANFHFFRIQMFEMYFSRFSQRKNDVAIDIIRSSYVAFVQMNDVYVVAVGVARTVFYLSISPMSNPNLRRRNETTSSDTFEWWKIERCCIENWLRTAKLVASAQIHANNVRRSLSVRTAIPIGYRTYIQINLCIAVRWIGYKRASHNRPINREDNSFWLKRIGSVKMKVVFGAILFAALAVRFHCNGYSNRLFNLLIFFLFYLFFNRLWALKAIWE